MVDSVGNEVYEVQILALGQVKHPVVFSVKEETMQNVLSYGPVESTYEHDEEDGKWIGKVVDVVHVVHTIQGQDGVRKWNVPHWSLAHRFEEPVVK